MQCYTAQPICTPSRGALLTGRLPVRIGFFQNVSINGTGLSQDEGTQAPCVYSVALDSVFWYDSIGGLQPSEITIPALLKQKNYNSFAVGKWHVGDGYNQEYLPLQRGFDYFYGLPITHGGNQGN